MTIDVTFCALWLQLCLYSQSYGFSTSHVQMWELDHKEGYVLKNWRFWIVVLEKTLESPLDSKEIKPVNPKGYQPWIVIGRTDAEAEAPILWLPDAESQLIRKDLMLGKIEGRKRRGCMCMKSFPSCFLKSESHLWNLHHQTKFLNTEIIQFVVITIIKINCYSKTSSLYISSFFTFISIYFQ